MKNLIYIFLVMATCGSGVLYSCKQESEGRSGPGTVSGSSRDSYNDPAEEASGKEQGEGSSTRL